MKNDFPKPSATNDFENTIFFTVAPGCFNHYPWPHALLARRRTCFNEAYLVLHFGRIFEFRADPDAVNFVARHVNHLIMSVCRLCLQRPGILIIAYLHANLASYCTRSDALLKKRSPRYSVTVLNDLMLQTKASAMPEPFTVACVGDV